jgi:hypothetical protein
LAPGREPNPHVRRRSRRRGSGEWTRALVARVRRIVVPAKSTTARRSPSCRSPAVGDGCGIVHGHFT